MLLEVIPQDAKTFIEALDKVYPERCPKLDQNDREIWMYAGKRELIRQMKQKLELQLSKGEI